MSSNSRKDELLGESHGTANGRLRKAILFDLAGRCGMLRCYRCAVAIEFVDELSIEHKDPWQRATDPRASFFDLKNIAFSHLRCNVLDGNARQRAENFPGQRKGREIQADRGINLSALGVAASATEGYKSLKKAREAQGENRYLALKKGHRTQSLIAAAKREVG